MNQDLVDWTLARQARELAERRIAQCKANPQKQVNRLADHAAYHKVVNYLYDAAIVMRRRIEAAETENDYLVIAKTSWMIRALIAEILPAARARNRNCDALMVLDGRLEKGEPFYRPTAGVTAFSATISTDLAAVEHWALVELGRDAPASGGANPLTVAEIVQRRDVSDSTVTRWAERTNQPKPKGKYAIPESAIPREWPLRSKPRQHRPALPQAVEWECESCHYDKEKSRTRPAKCPKCGKNAMLRKRLNPLAD